MRFQFHRRWPALAAAALILSSIFFMNAAAQTVNTTVTGTVKDPTGAVIAGARVVLTDAATKLSVNTTTNNEGFYLINDVRSGYYTVDVEATGFKKAEVRGV